MFKNVLSPGQSSWYKANLSDHATIDFPGKPQLILSENGVTQIGYKDNLNYYVVDIEDLSGYGIELRQGEIEALYNGIMTGFFKHPQHKALVKNTFTVDDLEGMEVIYSAELNENTNLRYKRLLFYNGKIFSYEFWTTLLNEERSKADREKYFNSFSITLDKAIVKQYTIV